MMKKIILKKLYEIEKEHDIKILYSCESGSRAWGFPSLDSDYDIRFIYSRPLDKYFTIEPQNDQLSFPINDELDIYGWDISKVLQLITKSNTTPFEWLQSPIIYIDNKIFREELWQLCQSYFCCRNNVHHYLGIARGAMKTMQNEEIKIKKLFYVLRPMLAALWCVEKNSIAPMDITPLMSLFTKDLRQNILSIIELKLTAKESSLIRVDQDIKLWIDETFDLCTEVSKNIEKKNFNMKKADQFFKKIILS